MTTLADFKKADIRPPGPPAPMGYKVGVVNHAADDDQAHYILKPDTQFYRPWLASPGGSAFVWPIGVEGFTFTSNAQAGIHHYIGDNDVDVQLVYPDELHIVLTGSFYGRTSVQNMLALRAVILQKSSEAGKILALPGIESQILYVSTINHQFNHDQTDHTRSVSYSIEFIKVGTGGGLKTPPLQLPSANPLVKSAPRGKSQSRTVVKQGKQTLRSISSKLYGDFSSASVLKLMQKNTETFSDQNLPLYKAVNQMIPPGTKLNF